MAHEHRRTDSALKRQCIWVERVQRWARACRERVSVAEDAQWRSLERSGLTSRGGETHKQGPRPWSSHFAHTLPTERLDDSREYMELSAHHRSHARHLRIAWLDETYHPDVYYYDVLRTHLQAFGHNVETRRPPMRAGDANQRKQATGQPVPFSEIDNEARQFDVVIASFGWMSDENPSRRVRRLPGWQTDTGALCKP